MSVTRTAKGTVTGWDDLLGVSTVQINSVSVAEDATLVVAVNVVGAGDFPGTCTWNGNSMTLQASPYNSNGLSGVLAVFVLQNASAGTGNIVWTFGTSMPIAVAMVATELQNVEPLSFDKTAEAGGTGTSASSGATATTAQANEMLLGFIGALDSSASLGGTWQNSFTNGQEAASQGGSGSDDAIVNEGFRQVTATGAYTAAKTGIVSAPWQAAILTFKELAAPISTPDSVEIATALPAPTVVPGAASSTPAATEIVAGVPAPTSVPGLRVIPVDAVGAAFEAGFTDGVVVPDSYDPLAVTTKLSRQSFGSPTPLSSPQLTVIRAKDANLKDQRLDTYDSDSSGIGPTSETLAIVMSGVDPDDIAEAGAISYVTMHCMARLREGDGGSVHRPTASNARFSWGSGTAVLTAPLPSGPYSAVPEAELRSTGPIATRNGSDPWQWSDLTSGTFAVWSVLVDVAIVDVGDFAQLDVAEVWMEVHGPIGLFAPPVRIPMRMARPVRVKQTLQSDE